MKYLLNGRLNIEIEIIQTVSSLTEMKWTYSLNASKHCYDLKRKKLKRQILKLHLSCRFCFLNENPMFFLWKFHKDLLLVCRQAKHNYFRHSHRTSHVSKRKIGLFGIWEGRGNFKYKMKMKKIFFSFL